MKTTVANHSKTWRDIQVFHTGPLEAATIQDDSGTLTSMRYSIQRSPRHSLLHPCWYGTSSSHTCFSGSPPHPPLLLETYENTGIDWWLGQSFKGSGTPSGILDDNENDEWQWMRMNGFVVDVNSYFNSAPRPFKGMSHNPPRNEWHEVLNASNGTWIEAVAFLTRTKSLSCE